MAYQIKGHHFGRSQIADFLCPDDGHRGTQRRLGKNVRNHMRDNRLIIKYTEARTRERREQDEAPKPELYKLAQFRNVETRLYEPAPVNENQLNRSNSEFMQRGAAEKRLEDRVQEGRAARAEIERKMEDARYLAARPTTPRKEITPKSTEVAKLAPRSNADFIRRNRANALAMVPNNRRAIDDDKEQSKPANYGKVPDYLQQRNAQWEEEKEERKRRAPDPNCPPGMKLMPESERLETLEVLHQSKTEAMKQLQAMPFVIETPSLKRKQSQLEDKLREIEHAIGLFSKTKVFVHLNA